MSVEQIFNKMASSNLEIHIKSISDNTISNEEKDKICNYMNTLLSNNFYVSTETDLEKFIHEIKTYKLQNSLDIVFVDYINKYIDYSDKDLMTNQLGKISESDIQDSARIEQDSDSIIGLYREIKLDDRAYGDLLLKKGKLDYYSMDADKNPNCINAVIIKNRFGERGTCALKWEGKYSRISNF